MCRVLLLSLHSTLSTKKDKRVLKYIYTRLLGQPTHCPGPCALSENKLRDQITVTRYTVPTPPFYEMEFYCTNYTYYSPKKPQKMHT